MNNESVKMKFWTINTLELMNAVLTIWIIDFKLRENISIKNQNKTSPDIQNEKIWLKHRSVSINNSQLSVMLSFCDEW